MNNRAPGTLAVGRVKYFGRHHGEVNSSAFSPNGQTLLTASDDGCVYGWETQTGQLLWKLGGHTGAVKFCRFSPDGRLFASTSCDCTIRLWDVARAKCLQVLKGHQRSVETVSFSPDSRQLASGGWDKRVMLWEVQVRGRAGVQPVLEGQPAAWDTETHTLHTGSRLFLHSFVLLAQTLLWFRITHAHMSAATSPGLPAHTSPHALRPLHMRFLLPGLPFLSLSSRHWKPPQIVLCVILAWQPCKEGLGLRGLEPGTLRFLGCPPLPPAAQASLLQSGQMLRLLLGHRDSVQSSDFSPSADCLATGSWDSTVRIWDLRAGTPKTFHHKLEGHSGNISCVCYSPSGLLASGSWDKTIRIWKPQPASLLVQLKGHVTWVKSIAFSPNELWLVSAGYSRLIKVWDCNTGKCIETLKGILDVAHSCAFTPDGKLLVSGAADQAC
nr:WD repeat-containing protein 38 [Loxodonta africana]